ncbi:MAG: hypothetical protein KGL39_46695 [Patescibacteria group bacterium]|nr:hypothetical protein [Patescibacteria group bacterium]
MQLSPDEAKEFADAAVNVAKHYDIGASAKAIAWTDLAMVAGSIYGVRAMTIMNRKHDQQRQGPAPAANGHDRTAAGAIDLSLMRGTTGNA